MAVANLSPPVFASTQHNLNLLSLPAQRCIVPPSPPPRTALLPCVLPPSFPCLSFLSLLGGCRNSSRNAQPHNPTHRFQPPFTIHLTPPIEVVAMAFVVSSLVGALPKAHAFIGGGVRSLPKQPASAARWGFVTAASTTAATPAAFARRSPGALSRYWAGGAVATTRRTAATPPAATASLTRGLTGSLPMFASAGGGVMETVAVEAKHVLVPVADGSEEIESVTIIDTLVRAGAVVTVASVGADIEV